MHGSTGGGWKRNASASPRQLPTQPTSTRIRTGARRSTKRSEHAKPRRQPVATGRAASILSPGTALVRAGHVTESTYPRTHLFAAQNAARYERQKLIEQYEVLTGARFIVMI